MQRWLLLGLPVVLASAFVTAATAAPPGPPPKVSGAGGAPPPAWIEVGKRSVWLAYSSYCWSAGGTALCVDFVPPSMRKDIPTVSVRRGQIARLHFGFRPTRVSVGARKLVPGRVARWRVTKPGVALVAVAGPAGDASYVVRIRLR